LSVIVSAFLFNVERLELAALLEFREAALRLRALSYLALSKRLMRSMRHCLGSPRRQ
jgi:hypothetical protein